MRCDVVSIFPEYLEPLDLSLPGQAQRKGLLDLHVHDLREFAHDRHRTVDDTPYGGGAGMVMKVQPWWEALDHVRGLHEGTPTLIVPGPGGEVFTQRLARELAQEDWLVFACGRYEGIDERVYEAASEVMPVRVISLGDYVLNGGEVAVLAMIEAAARLLPGFMGNAESLVEESHEDGLLEYPVYTKPASWQGRDVPPVLLSGDHGKVAAWRHQQRLERTAARRPDLLSHAAALNGEVFEQPGSELRLARAADLGELFALRCAYVPSLHARGSQEATARAGAESGPVTDLESLRRAMEHLTTWVLRIDGRLVATVSARVAPDDDQTWQVGDLFVAPDLQGRGIGRAMFEHAVAEAPGPVRRVRLLGVREAGLERPLKRAGYRKRQASAADEGSGFHGGPLTFERRLGS